MKNIIACTVGVVIILVAIFYFGNQAKAPGLGSSNVGNDYMSTSTYNQYAVPQFATSQVIRNSGGTLGSVIITGAVAGTMRFVDATSTTDTGSTTIATFPASAAANTYTFDVEFLRGLIVVTSAFLAPTTTITYR